MENVLEEVVRLIISECSSVVTMVCKKWKSLYGSICSEFYVTNASVGTLLSIVSSPNQLTKLVFLKQFNDFQGLVEDLLDGNHIFKDLVFLLIEACDSDLHALEHSHQFLMLLPHIAPKLQILFLENTKIPRELVGQLDLSFKYYEASSSYPRYRNDFCSTIFDELRSKFDWYLYEIGSLEREAEELNKERCIDLKEVESLKLKKLKWKSSRRDFFDWSIPKHDEFVELLPLIMIEEMVKWCDDTDLIIQILKLYKNWKNMKIEVIFQLKQKVQMIRRPNDIFEIILQYLQRTSLVGFSLKLLGCLNVTEIKMISEHIVLSNFPNTELKHCINSLNNTKLSIFNKQLEKLINKMSIDMILSYFIKTQSRSALIKIFSHYGQKFPPYLVTYMNADNIDLLISKAYIFANIPYCIIKYLRYTNEPLFEKIIHTKTSSPSWKEDMILDCRASKRQISSTDGKKYQALKRDKGSNLNPSLECNNNEILNSEGELNPLGNYLENLRNTTFLSRRLFENKMKYQQLKPAQYPTKKNFKSNGKPRNKFKY